MEKVAYECFGCVLQKGPVNDHCLIYINQIQVVSVKQSQKQVVFTTHVSHRGHDTKICILTSTHFSEALCGPNIQPKGMGMGPANPEELNLGIGVDYDRCERKSP